MNIDSMVESWDNMLLDNLYRNDEYLKCDYCEEEKHEDSDDWQQTPLDKSLALCSEECKKEFEQEFHNDLNEIENMMAPSLFLSSTVSELRQKLGHANGRGTFEHENTKSVLQDWNSRETIVIFKDMSKLHFSSDQIRYTL
ncbi:hypothetical protein OAF54_02030 [bacterium]|nr:hypothetical protein [bacterium]